MTARHPRVYKTECLVLSRRNLGEADSIFTLLSPEHGRFDAIARGVRKARSHMRGHLEPLTRVRVMVAQGRSLDVLTQAEASASHAGLRDDLDRYAAATYAAELARRFSPEREPLAWLYGLLSEVLELIEQGARLSVLRAYEVRLLEGAGFGQRFDVCAGCSERLPAEPTFFSPVAGGFVCRGCRSEGGAGRLVSVAGVKVLRHAARSTLAEFAALRLDDGLGLEVEAALGDAIRWTLEDEPRSGHFIAEVRGLYRAGAPRVGPAAADVQLPH